MVDVSIVIPAYNSINYIERAINSVKKQTFSDWEMIIVDDCSDDGTVELVDAYAKLDSRIRLIRLEKNGGAAVARNAAIRAAQGRYISFLDSDDQWLPHKLESQLAFVRKYDAAFVFAAYRRVDESGNELVEIGVPDTVSYQKLLKCNYIGCLTAMYDSEKLGKVETPLISFNEDLSLWLRLLKKTSIAYGQNEILASYTVRPGSVSADKLKTSASQWKIYREIEKIGFIAACYYFTYYAFFGVLRTYLPRLGRALGVVRSIRRSGG